MKIDDIFTDVISITLKAQYAKREEKLGLLIQITQKLDTIKYFITILWETKGIDSGKYTQLAQKLSSAGTMLGGWIKKMQSSQNKTPPT